MSPFYLLLETSSDNSKARRSLEKAALVFRQRIEAKPYGKHTIWHMEEKCQHMMSFIDRVEAAARVVDVV